VARREGTVPHWYADATAVTSMAQPSINAAKPLGHRLDVGGRLASLRDEDILKWDAVSGTGEALTLTRP